MGGALAAIERGFVQREIQEAAYQYQRQVEKGEATIVGVNKFTNKEPQTHQLLRIDESAAKRQLARLNEVKSKRDAQAVQRSLKRVDEVARNGENTMPVFIEAVENYVTLGEICDTLRKTWGVYKEAIVF